MMINDNTISIYDQIFLDLDDTLIYEREYLFSAYYEISIVFGKNSGDVLKIYNYLRNNFEQGKRSKLFNNLIEEFEMPPSNMGVMLEILRNVKLKEKLNLVTEVKCILLELRKLKKQYIVITNGNPVQQANKIKQINWEGHLRPTEVIFANEYEPKPSPLTMEVRCKTNDRKRVLYIGDSDIDRDFALNAGVSFYRLEIKSSCFDYFIQ